MSNRDKTFINRSASNDRHSWLTYWQLQNQPWRTEPEIDAQRQDELRACLTTIPDVENGIYPFKNEKLTRADIEWLLAMHLREREAIHLSSADQWEPKGLDLRGADLRNVDFRRLPLAGMHGGLNWEEWNYANIEQREGAAAHLEGANLSFADLRGAILRGTHFERAILYGVHLERAYLYSAHMEGAVLNQVYFDDATQLGKVIFGNEIFGVASLADVHWGDVNLTVVDWEAVQELGDERIAEWRKELDGAITYKERQLTQRRRAVRANRQLADALQAQGLHEEAARFAYRAKKAKRHILWIYMLQPKVHLSQRLRTFAAYLFSLFLDFLAGYGYKPVRSLSWYLIIILGFATLYSVFGHISLVEAITLSLTSFHGRGFFPSTNISLNDPWVVLAAVEAVGGLFIEISFIATFTQRYFGK